jgi:hypothetical protein
MKPTALHIERWLDGVEARIVPPERRGLRVIIHEGDDKAAAMEKALAEHVACHPEDAGRTVKDFRWVVREIVRRQGWRLETVDGVERAVFEGDTDGRKPSETETPETIEGKFEDTDKDTDGPSETLEPIDLPPPDPGCLARSKPWRPVHQRPARDQRRPTWKKWER